MAPHEIVIIGGGVGGTLAANILAHKLTRRRAHVTLIDRTGRHCFQPGWLYVPFGGEPPEHLERNERSLLDRRVTLAIGDVAKINRGARLIEMADGMHFPYDTLIIATGARLAPELLPGFSEGAHHFYSAEAALQLHAALRAFTGGRVVVGAADLPYKCPPAPLEFTFLLEDYLRQHGLREQTEIVYLSALSRVFPIENIANFADPLLHERGIRTELRFTPSAIDAPAKVIRSAEGAALPYDLLVLVPPHRGAQIVCEAGLGDTLGWVPTDRETLQCTLDPNIYAVGDAADLPISKSGSAAHFGAKVVANRIIAELLHRHELPRYTGEVMCFIETGQGQASQVVFDYNHPPQLPAPNQLYHYEKTLFNRFYWYLVPNGVV